MNKFNEFSTFLSCIKTKVAKKKKKKTKKKKKKKPAENWLGAERVNEKYKMTHKVNGHLNLPNLAWLFMQMAFLRLFPHCVRQRMKQLCAIVGQVCAHLDYQHIPIS